MNVLSSAVSQATSLIVRTLMNIVKKRHLVLGICLVGSALIASSAIRTNAQSSDCDLSQTTLSRVVATSTIPLVKGQVLLDVDNPTPFITGMRVRAMSGTTITNTKYVEGTIGIIRDCTIALNVDFVSGTGTIKNARFSVAGVRGLTGLRGPRGIAGLRGATGLQGPIGASGVKGDTGATGTKGDTGTTGLTGAKGDAGATGAKGDTGATGDAGATGPQGIQGVQGIQGIQGIQGPVGPFGSYGSFYSTETQTLTTTNTPIPMTFNQVAPGVGGAIANGVSVVDGSKVLVEDAGVYNIQFSAQVAKADAGIDTMDIWLNVDGVAVPWTNTSITIDTAKRYVAAWNLMVELTAGQYFQLVYSTADIQMSLLAVPPQTGPTRPGIPSVIITVTQVQ